MTPAEHNIQRFQTRVRQLILAYEQKEADNERLKQTLQSKDEEISALKSQLQQSQQEYKTLKVAKMFEMGSEDVEAAKAHLAKLIKDIDKCISLIKE